MGQRHVRHPERAILAQHGEPPVDLVAALDPDQRRDPPRLGDPADVVGGGRQRERRRVRCDHPAGDVDLFERHLDGAGPRDVGGDPHRPELCADMALAQPFDVGLQRMRQRRGIVPQIERLDRTALVAADFPGEVVMAVDDRRLGEHALDARGDRRVGGLRDGGAREQRQRDRHPSAG